MNDVKLDDWTIRVVRTEYTIWIAPNNTKVIIEYDNRKIATIGKDLDGKIKVFSQEAIAIIDTDNKLITIGSQLDRNNLGDEFHWHQ